MLTKLLSKRSDEGFTLLELLIVVIVIGILAAIALPVFLSQQAAAYDASAQSDVRNTVGQVVGWNALNRGTPALSATGYVEAGGKLTQSPHSYVGLSVAEDGSYKVCGYNTKGNKYSAYNKAWAFDSTTGKSGASSEECVNAYHVREPATDTSGDSAGSDSTLITTVTPAGGSAVTLVRDPNGKYTTATPNPGDGTGGENNPTTGDPGDKTTKLTLNYLTAVENNSYQTPAVIFRFGASPAVISADGYYRESAWKPYELSEDQVVESAGTPVANGVTPTHSVTSPVTNLKFYDVSGNQKVAETLANCTYSAKIVPAGSYDSAFPGTNPSRYEPPASGKAVYLAKITCTDTSFDTPVFAENGYCSTDATTANCDPDYVVPASKYLTGGYMTFTDGNGGTNRINFGSPFAYIFDE